MRSEVPSRDSASGDAALVGHDPAAAQALLIVRLAALVEAVIELREAQRRAGAFKAITKKAGIGENWTPRELRHSFVSIMSDNGVPIETIADLVGHASTAVTEEVYRHQLNRVITKGAETMNTIFNQQKQVKSA